MVIQSPPEHHPTDSATVAAAVLAGDARVEVGSAPSWLPDNAHASHVLFNAISSGGTLPGPGCIGRNAADLQSIIHTDIGRGEFGQGMATYRREIADEPDVLLPDFWQLFLLSSLTASGADASPGLRRHVTTHVTVEAAHHRGGYAIVAAAAGGVQSRGGAVGGCGT